MIPGYDSFGLPHKAELARRCHQSPAGSIWVRVANASAGPSIKTVARIFNASGIFGYASMDSPSSGSVSRFDLWEGFAAIAADVVPCVRCELGISRRSLEAIRLCGLEV